MHYIIRSAICIESAKNMSSWKVFHNGQIHIPIQQSDINKRGKNTVFWYSYCVWMVCWIWKLQFQRLDSCFEKFTFRLISSGAEEIHYRPRPHPHNTVHPDTMIPWIENFHHLGIMPQYSRKSESRMCHHSKILNYWYLARVIESRQVC